MSSTSHSDFCVFKGVAQFGLITFSLNVLWQTVLLQYLRHVWRTRPPPQRPPPSPRASRHRLPTEAPLGKCTDRHLFVLRARNPSSIPNSKNGNNHQSHKRNCYHCPSPRTASSFPRTCDRCPWSPSPETIPFQSTWFLRFSVPYPTSTSTRGRGVASTATGPSTTEHTANRELKGYRLTSDSHRGEGTPDPSSVAPSRPGIGDRLSTSLDPCTRRGCATPWKKVSWEWSPSGNTSAEETVPIMSFCACRAVFA